MVGGEDIYGGRQLPGGLMNRLDRYGHLFCNDFNELVDLSVAFNEAHAENIHATTQERRARLSSYVEAFHEASGTLTPSVMRSVENLRDGNCIVIMAGHQPNLFPYSGVLRKATLLFALARKLEERTKVPVVSFFGLADQDFTDDRWVKSCQLPAITRGDGILDIEMKCPRKKMLNAADKPSTQVLGKWKADVDKWLDDAAKSVDTSCNRCPQGPRPSRYSSELHANANSFWDIVQDSHGRSTNYSDFNAFVMSKIVNDVWGYDTTFARFSECQQAFADDFGYLLSRFGDYSKSLREAVGRPSAEGVNGGVSVNEPELAPFWYHCDCGSKARVSIMTGREVLTGIGNCVSCGKHFELDLGTVDNPRLSEVAPKISARSIAMNLIFFRGLEPSCYVGGFGAIGYLMEAEHVGKAIGIPFPPMAIWRPDDSYLGLGQLEALLHLKRICTSLGTRGYHEAEAILTGRIQGARGHLKELETSRLRVMKEAEAHPENEALKEEKKAISMKETRVKKELNLSVLNRNLTLLRNAPRVLNLAPSILDYAINIGLKETSVQWIRHLEEVGDLSSDVSLDSILSRDEKLRRCLLSDLAYCTDELRLKVRLPVQGATR
jgi:hypothetical protein